MNRIPFLFLAALGVGVPITLAFTPCDHKKDGKSKSSQTCSVCTQSNVACSQGSAACTAPEEVSVVGENSGDIKPVIAQAVAVRGRGQSSARNGHCSAPAVAVVRQHSANGAATPVTAIGSAGGGQNAACDSTCTSSSSAACAPCDPCTQAAGSVNPAPAKTHALGVTRAGGLAPLNANKPVALLSLGSGGNAPLTVVSGQQAEPLALNALTVDGSNMLAGLEGELTVLAAQDPAKTEQMRKIERDYAQTISEAQREVQERMREVQAQMQEAQQAAREAQEQARTELESGIREAMEQARASMLEAQQAIREALEERRQAEREAQQAMRESLEERRLAQREAEQEARESNSQEQRQKHKDKSKSDSKKETEQNLATFGYLQAQGSAKQSPDVFAKLPRNHAAPDAGSSEYTRQLEKRVAELEHELGQLRDGQGRKPGKVRSFKFDADGRGGAVYEIESEADEDSKDCDEDEQSGEEVEEHESAADSAAAGSFTWSAPGGGSFWRTEPGARAASRTPRSPTPPTPPTPPALPTAPCPPAPPVAPAPPGANWWSGSEIPAPAEMDNPLPHAPAAQGADAFFLGATPSMRGAPAMSGQPSVPAIQPPEPTNDFAPSFSPMPDSGELEGAMRELRDEIRALRESMQGLRERIHSMAGNSLR